MRKRIGFGVIVLVLTSVATTFLELNVWESPEIRLLWFVLPVFLVSFAEVSTIIPCKCCLCLAYHHNYYHGDYLYTVLEFVYAQSPDNMKGLLTGVCYLLLGIWNTLLTVVIFYFTKYVTTDDCGHRGLSVANQSYSLVLCCRHRHWLSDRCCTLHCCLLLQESHS